MAHYLNFCAYCSMNKERNFNVPKYNVRNCSVRKIGLLWLDGAQVG